LALTKRRRLFVQEYLANPGKPASWAVIKAGFSEKRAKETASELLKDPDIKAAIEHKINSKFEQVEINEKLVLIGILRTIERCVESGSGAWQISNALKGYEMLGRHLKMFTERIELDLGDKIMAALLAGRKRAGLPPPTLEQKEK